MSQPHQNPTHHQGTVLVPDAPGQLVTALAAYIANGESVEVALRAALRDWCRHLRAHGSTPECALVRFKALLQAVVDTTVRPGTVHRARRERLVTLFIHEYFGGSDS